LADTRLSGFALGLFGGFFDVGRQVELGGIRLRPWASDFHIVFIVFGLGMPLLFLAQGAVVSEPRRDLLRQRISSSPDRRDKHWRA